MKLFKSKQDREIERRMQLRRCMRKMNNHLASLEKNEKGYVEKARRARQMGDGNLYGVLKKMIQKTASQRILIEREMLMLQTMTQMKGQAEAHAEFAKAMSSVSKTISELFGSTDMVKLEKNFEKSRINAENFESKMADFIEMSASSMIDQDFTAERDIITEDEVERMVSDENYYSRPRDEIDDEIDRNLKDIEAEIRRSMK